MEKFNKRVRVNQCSLDDKSATVAACRDPNSRERTSSRPLRNSASKIENYGFSSDQGHHDQSSDEDSKEEDIGVAQ